MFASKTEIVLYSVLAVGIVAGLAFGVSQWLLICFAVVIGVADSILSRRRRAQPEPRQLEWPWQRAGFWIVLASIGIGAAALAALGATIGIIALVCGLVLAFYAYDVARQIELVRERRKGTRGIGPGVEHWTLLATSVAFCVIALVLLEHDWRTAVVTLTFFGACALVFWTNILRKRREKHWQGATVQVRGGVNVYAQGARMGVIAFGCVLVGCVCYFVGSNYPLLFRLLGAVIALVGVGVAIALALGFYRRQYLRFDPDTITFGERLYRFQVSWDNIAEVVSIEYADNPFVGVRLFDVDIVEVEPEDQTQTFRAHLANNRAVMNVDLFIAPRNFGIDALILAAALTRYAINPAAREELQRRFAPAIGSIAKRRRRST
jgi:Ca2+/Na+ antiporter